MAQTKTNVMRILEQKKVPYQAHSYPHGKELVDGMTVARLLGQDPRQVYKTLVAYGHSKNHYVFVIPVESTLDLKKAAKAAGDKKIEMTHVKELLGLTGYIRGGCSPVGMKKKYPTWIDETAMLYDEIAVSAGVRGAQIIINPEALKTFTEAVYADVTQ